MTAHARDTEFAHWYTRLKLRLVTADVEKLEKLRELYEDASAGSHLTPLANRILDQALREALSRGKGTVGPEHLLLALLRLSGSFDPLGYLSVRGLTAKAYGDFLDSKRSTVMTNDVPITIQIGDEELFRVVQRVSLRNGKRNVALVGERGPERIALPVLPPPTRRTWWQRILRALRGTA